MQSMKLKPVAFALFVGLAMCLWFLLRGHNAPLKLKWQPEPYVLQGFLQDADCDEIVRLALAEGLEQSKLGDSSTSDVRTSHSATLDPNGHPLLSRMYDNVADMLGKPRSHMENLQVLRYKPGQEYQAHHDSCLDSGNKIERYATVLVYLNNVADGGETIFPLQKIKVRPQKGKAVVFFSMTQDAQQILEECLHSASPPSDGEKWVAVVWVHQRPFPT